MAMIGGVGAGGSGGDEPWGWGRVGNGNCNGNGKQAAVRERENNRRREIASRIFAVLRKNGNYTLPRNWNGNGKPAAVRGRENERRRERRRRRVIASRIFAALRENGNYTLPRNCDNNDLLMAVCKEAGWTVEADGTTYREEPKPPARDQQMADIGGSFAPVNPGGEASYSLTRPPSPSGITLGGSGSGGSYPVPVFSFRRSGAEQAAGAREEEMPEMNADEEEEGLELTLGNVETLKDLA